MQTALIIIGVTIGVFSIALLIGYFFILPALYVAFTPAPDSNEALRNWLLCHPGADIDDYLHNKPDRCVIQ